MAYYGQGDYYAAGGVFSFLGKVGKAVVGGAVGLATGGIGGAVRGAVTPFIPSQPLPVPPSYPGPTGPANLPVQVPLPGVLPAVQRLLPGGETGMAAGIPPRGYHLNKSGYFLKSGEYVPPRSRYVRNRSRNPANGRALNRAIGRVSAFNNVVKRSRKNLRSLAKV